MGSVYQPSFRNAAGKLRHSPTWRMKYRDEHGKLVNVTTGVRDERSAREILRAAELRVDRIRAGLPVADAPGTRKPIAAAIAAWDAEHARLGRDAYYRKKTVRMMTDAAVGAGWRYVTDIKADSLRDYLAAKSAAGHATATVNGYRTSVAMLVEFSIDQGWLSSNPIARVKPATVTRTRPRRAFTQDELGRLLSVAKPNRRLVYAVAATSGLRRKELRLLERQDCTPTGSNPTWHLRREINKARRVERVQMLAECADLLRPLWQELPSPASRLFPRMPSFKVFNRDIERAGIRKRDDAGKEVSFHCLRYYFCVQLGRTLPIQVVRKLMRHSTITLTVDLYMALGIQDVADELSNLPAILPSNKSGKSDKPARRKKPRK